MRFDRIHLRRAWLILPIAMVGLLVTISSKPKPVVQRIVVGLEEDIRGTDPQRELDGLADPVNAHVVEGLVGLKDDLSVGLMLAEAVKVSENGRVYTFTLRSNVRFHNGAILNSSHVKWSWDYLMAPRSLWRCRPLLSGETQATKVESVQTPAPLTVVFRLAAPSRSFLEILARLDCAQTPILHPASLNADGSWNKPIGTGPFKLKQRRVGESLDLERFASYSSRRDAPDGMVGAKRALVDEIRFLVVGDPSARMMALQSGDMHVSLIPPPLVAAAKNSRRLETVVSASTEWNVILLNSQDPLLKDKRIRQAIAAAIDRDAIAKVASYGLAGASMSPLPEFTPYFSKTTRAKGANPGLAKKLLAAAGYKGQKLIITTNMRYQPMFDAAVMVESMLRASGINAKIEVIEWGLQLSRYNSRQYQAMSFGYSGTFSSGESWDRFVGTAKREPWNSSKAIELINLTERSNSPQEMIRANHELQLMLEEDVPAVSLFIPTFTVVKNRNLTGFQGSHFDALRLWNVSLAQNSNHSR
jgi:peptide/nickel transport system substrate-binding protein